MTMRCSSDTGYALLLALPWLPALRLTQHILQQYVKKLLPVGCDPGAVAEPLTGWSGCLKQASALCRWYNEDSTALFHFSHCLNDACHHQPPTPNFVTHYEAGWPVVHWPFHPSHSSLFWQWLYHRRQMPLLKIITPDFLISTVKEDGGKHPPLVPSVMSLCHHPEIHL